MFISPFLKALLTTCLHLKIHKSKIHPQQCRASVMCRTAGCSPAALQTASYKVTACWNPVYTEATLVIYINWRDYNVDRNVSFICRKDCRLNCNQWTFAFLFCIVQFLCSYKVSYNKLFHYADIKGITLFSVCDGKCWQKGYFRASLCLLFKDPQGNWFQYVPDRLLPHLTLKENSLACIISGICCTNDTLHTKQLVSPAVVGLLKQKAQNGM